MSRELALRSTSHVCFVLRRCATGPQCFNQCGVCQRVHRQCCSGNSRIHLRVQTQLQQRFFHNVGVISVSVCSLLHPSSGMQCTCMFDFASLGAVSIAQCSFVHISSTADAGSCGSDRRGVRCSFCQMPMHRFPHMCGIFLVALQLPGSCCMQRTCTPRLESLGLVSISPCFFAHMQRMLGAGSLCKL